MPFAMPGAHEVKHCYLVLLCPNDARAAVDTASGFISQKVVPRFLITESVKHSDQATALQVLLPPSELSQSLDQSLVQSSLTTGDITSRDLAGVEIDNNRT
ncbi:hypothetical protein EJB05_39636 [Eragrostis curvula]|uniref:Uncharacterized protein n=1 Tax=Eragrostis curvula TaxID=38414 RepID=A0A5J9TYZ4_9POAL|nr:hypothetical protein EJB05_39636 [Eragrostis curvula]